MTAVVQRRNLTIDPEATGTAITAGHLGWLTTRWFGPSGAGTHTWVTGAADGPAGLGIGTYLRKTWTAGTTGSNGDSGFAHDVASSNPATTGGYPVTPGQAYTFSSYLRSSSGGQTARMTVFWHDAAGAIIGSEERGSDTVLPAGQWTRIWHTGTAPPTAAAVGPVSDVDWGTFWQAGDHLDGTGLLVEARDQLDDYFDGATPGVGTPGAEGAITYAWVGTADASQSTQSLETASVRVTPTVELNNVPPRVRLDVTVADGSTAVTVTRLDPDGGTTVVRTVDGAAVPISSGVGLVYDYEPPYGQAVAYSTLEAAAVVSGPVTVDEQQVWLVHPGVPALSQPILAADITGRTRRVQRGVFYPQGARYPVARTDGQRKTAEYTLTIRTTTDADRIAVDDLLDDAGVLLLNVPAGRGWGITSEYVSAGDSVEDRLYGYAREQRRHWTLPLTVVARPQGGTQAERTFNDLLADYATLADLQAAYTDLNAVLAGP